MTITIRPIQAGEDATCGALLRALPEWFGIEEAVAGYVRDLASAETWIADVDGRVVGFLSIVQLDARSAEIRVMAVAPGFHGQGCGRRLMESAERALRARSVEVLQVKTLSPSRPDAHYARTRGFYKRMGFRPIRETREWGDANPCLVMARRFPRMPE